jgi:hypothetical protein
MLTGYQFLEWQPSSSDCFDWKRHFDKKKYHTEFVRNCETGMVTLWVCDHRPWGEHPLTGKRFVGGHDLWLDAYEVLDEYAIEVGK